MTGNKSDLKDERQVTFLEASRFAQENDAMFLETSALTGKLPGVSLSHETHLTTILPYPKAKTWKVFLKCARSILSKLRADDQPEEHDRRRRPPYGNDDGNVSILLPDLPCFTCKAQANRETNITAGRRRQRQRWLVRLLETLVVAARVRRDAAVLLVRCSTTAASVDEPYTMCFPLSLIFQLTHIRIYVIFQTVLRKHASLRMPLHV